MLADLFLKQEPKCTICDTFNHSSSIKIFSIVLQLFEPNPFISSFYSKILTYTSYYISESSARARDTYQIYLETNTNRSLCRSHKTLHIYLFSSIMDFCTRLYSRHQLSSYYFSTKQQHYHFMSLSQTFIMFN